MDEKEIIAKLMQWRKERGISQECVAAFANVERSRISDCERGLTRLRVETASKWAKAVGYKLKFDKVSIGPREWTLDEIELVKVHYPITKWQLLLQLLPNRTKRAIENKALDLGVKREVEKIYGYRRRTE